MTRRVHHDLLLMQKRSRKRRGEKRGVMYVKQENRDKFIYIEKIKGVTFGSNQDI